MADTIQEHLNDCKKIADVVKNANDVVVKARDALMAARHAFEILAKVQHPMVNVSQNVSATTYCKTNADAISALLGDRPPLG
jgi:hypothetical protein